MAERLRDILPKLWALLFCEFRVTESNMNKDMADFNSIESHLNSIISEYCLNIFDDFLGNI